MVDRQQRARPERLCNVQQSPVPHFLLWSLLALVAFCALPGIAKAVVLDPPTMHCASVSVNGDVTVTWTIPPDPGGDFLSYEIWHATDIAGPFTLLTIPPIFVQGQVNYVHVGAGANAGAQFYFMVTNSTGPPPNVSVPSDTISTLFLQVFQSTPLGNANLSWNASALSASAAADFTVWLEYPIGTWTQIASVPNTTFSYQWVVDICEDSLTFRIGSADALGCTSFSNRDGEIFNDVTPPTVPVIIAVTVDSITGLSNIVWGQPPEPDTDGYIIVWNGPGGGVIIDTVFGAGNLSYEWPLSNPFDASEQFTIAAFDTCETGTPPSPNTSATGLPHATILAEIDYDRCSSQVRVHWSAYVGWAVQSYQVLVQQDGGPWALLGNVGGTELEYYHQTEPGHTYCYIIKGVQGVGQAESLSNKACIFTAYPSQPQFNYVRTVTVTSPSTILVVDSVDQFAQVSSYVVERSANGNAYTAMATIPGSAGPVISWTDSDVRPHDTGYLYRVQVRDSCGNPSVTSNIGSNILLRAAPDLRGINKLEWNGYIQWAGVLGTHSIYRSIDEGDFELIAVVPAIPWVYEDDVNAYVLSSGGRFCYYIEAQEVGNASGINATSVSNIACAAQQDLIYIPNGFIVGSGVAANREFKPVLGFVDVQAYTLLIINRWGQVIWETDDPDEAWDGEMNGTPCPIGVYGYFCAVTNGAGKRVEKRGTVTLLTAEE
ncbi:MAG: gliding motility-associated C-terminal domain-containing protein [Flavobacteriales bacterium]|nr:gliding motility-associated C-terminal domain-containing protein [Flavobacteriales bacterium]